MTNRRSHIACLFVESRGVYALFAQASRLSTYQGFGNPALDLWPFSRDARRYTGPWPVVAHPPCARWSKLAKLVERQGGAPAGEDGGEFKAALDAVRTFGGVLEHPAGSKAWGRYLLPKPHPGGGWSRGVLEERQVRGWVCEVDQSFYGHPARKRTWLYVVMRDGSKPPPMLWGEKKGVALVARPTRFDPRPVLTRKQRNRTPSEFAAALLNIAKLNLDTLERDRVAFASRRIGPTPEETNMGTKTKTLTAPGKTKAPRKATEDKPLAVTPNPAAEAALAQLAPRPDLAKVDPKPGEFTATLGIKLTADQLAFVSSHSTEYGAIPPSTFVRALINRAMKDATDSNPKST